MNRPHIILYLPCNPATPSILAVLALLLHPQGRNMAQPSQPEGWTWTWGATDWGMGSCWWILKYKIMRLKVASNFNGRLVVGALTSDHWAAIKWEESRRFLENSLWDTILHTILARSKIQDLHRNHLRGATSPRNALKIARSVLTCNCALCSARLGLCFMRCWICRFAYPTYFFLLVARGPPPFFDWATGRDNLLATCTVLNVSRASRNVFPPFFEFSWWDCYLLPRMRWSPSAVFGGHGSIVEDVERSVDDNPVFHPTHHIENLSKDRIASSWMSALVKLWSTIKLAKDRTAMEP